LYACRTAKSTVATWEDLTFHLDFLGNRDYQDLSMSHVSGTVP
jgi:hypothetical protein